MSCRKTEYKDLDKWRKARKRQKRRYRERTNSNLYNRRIWTIKEMNLILEHSMTDRELSELLKRSVGAIQVQRSRIKNERIKENAVSVP